MATPSTSLKPELPRLLASLLRAERRQEQNGQPREDKGSFHGRRIYAGSSGAGRGSSSGRELTIID
ncbi:MAG: hypothetical protein IID15_01300 [Candidatus Marinimicrobia bacterium]|nr:hypothetical protein [Candidatus Neomarinimicrobiota bacterium]